MSLRSACSVGSIEPSHVLAAIGLDEDQNKSSLRFSFGLTNTKKDIDYVVSTLKDIVDRLVQ